MVNGPRPSTLKVANSPAAPSDSPAAATSTSSMTAMSAARSPAPPVRSPTLLVRQATSMYSTCSTDETPLLRYGKEATPLQATWAEEPWDPSTLNAAAISRASAPAVLLTSNLEAAQDEDYDVDMDDDTATTTTDTATPFTKPAISISAPAPSASGTTASDEQPPLAAASATTTTTASEPNHVTVLFRHNPYAFVSRVELYRCPCGGCSAAQQALMAPSDEDVAVGTGTDFLAAPIYPTPAYAEHHQYDPQYDAYNTYAEDTGMGSQQPSSMDATAAPHPVATGSYHYGAVEDEMAYAVVEAPPASSFMPPPPPPRIARRVIAESGEAGLDAEAAFYHIVMRWYNKVVVAQVAWVPAGEECPEPNEEKFTFDEWVDEVGRWWLRHFEHAQVKTTPSSGLLRSSYSAPVVPLAAASGAAAGVRRAFESHTSAAMPRKVNGTSGLTAELLDNHNQAVLPAPRSLRVRKELPW